MSRELEQRLERALGQVESSATAEEQAREAALAALPGGGRGRYRLALVAAVVAVALVVTAGVTLAASRTARQAVGLAGGDHTRNRPGLRAGPLPPGSAGFAVYGGGKLWLASPGLRLVGKRYSAAELSPGALNVVLGLGRNLVVRRLSDGGIAWRHAAGGRVVAAAWAPIGTEIAYVVRADGSYQLRMIEGDGDHDRLLVAHVAPVAPSWRSDSLAIAYATPHEQVAVDDFTNGRTEVVKRPPDCPLITTWGLAFAPRGGVLAASIGDGNVLVADPRTGWAACAGAAMRVLGPLPPAQIAWVSDRILLAADDQFVDRMAVTRRSLSLERELAAPAGVDGLTVSPDAREIAFGLRRETHVEIVAARVPRPTDARLQVVRLLRNVPPSPVVMNGFYRLIWR